MSSAAGAGDEPADEHGTSASALLRERGAASWAAAVSHPMVAEIGAGSLPHETFRYYFEQNVLYLEDYARAIALIIGRAPGPGRASPC